ncbi:hypothetical protein LEMA_P039670.1 [Plenodomus lingam JN3]|uniref:Uncharacterized protein n=1 Tax=Leptosphaeria maculans (strain JN3 / isolate v23.1.3 / race Av1-4-5-6-7-8) TaxID=985895 RepID=E4ZNK7_LEPMJ|nr:hypothetical protein LEMA_P039670.1 [Plenodomus lingam JN3]CBX93066.1 hypothetical protein LEMA_P039670.1 [Plenodomus lingam JN3]
MPRKAVRTAAASASRSSSKRPAPDAPSRQSKRAKAAARQSYVEANTDTEGEGDAASSNYEDPNEKDQSSDEDTDESVSEDGTNAKQVTSRGRPAKSKILPVHRKHADEKELWKAGAKLAPGTQIVIKKPKARDAGDIPYTDETIHPNTMLFLQDLAANNDRQWLKLHDPDYRVAFQDFSTFTEKMSEKIIEADETIPELPVKDVIFRIYRDIRFSKDPTPYKTYFSAAWSRTGRKGPYAHYYVQIQPNGGSFVEMMSEPTCGHNDPACISLRLGAMTLDGCTMALLAQSELGQATNDCRIPWPSSACRVRDLEARVRSGGYWQPDAASLSKLRRDIDRAPDHLKSVLRNEGIRKAFLHGVQDDNKKVVKAFTSLPGNQSNALKRNPKDYAHDHKDIELLRLRSFTIGTKLADHEVVGPGGLDRIAELVRLMVPVQPTEQQPLLQLDVLALQSPAPISYLNGVCMPDDESSTSSADENENAAAESDGDEGSEGSS